MYNKYTNTIILRAQGHDEKKKKRIQLNSAKSDRKLFAIFMVSTYFIIYPQGKRQSYPMTSV